MIVNHLRNCVSDDSCNSFTIEIESRTVDDDNDFADDSFPRWVKGMLGSLSNFSCRSIDLEMECLDAVYVWDFLQVIHPALEECTWEWMLMDLWLQIEYLALRWLVEERFIQWEFIQRLRLIRIEVVRLHFGFTRVSIFRYHFASLDSEYCFYWGN